MRDEPKGDSSMQATTPTPLPTRRRPGRRRTLAKGVLKALFTTSPKEMTKVVAYDSDAVEIEPLFESEAPLQDADSSSVG
jgi:hypothetical protein